MPPLPPELWEFILDELSDESLLVAARACHSLNIMAIHLYLSRNRAIVDGASRSLAIRSHLLRAVALRVSSLPDISALECAFWTYGVGRDLIILRNIVKRWKCLTAVSLAFGLDVFAPNYDHYFGYKTKTQPETLQQIITRVARRNRGAFIVAIQGALYRCGKAAAPALWTAALDCAVGEMDLCVESLLGIHLWRVPFESGDGTLLTFNMPRLELKEGSQELSAKDISALLAQINIPSLVEFDLDAADIDPASFTTFLRKHTKLETLRVLRPSTKKLCETPISLANLSRLVANNPADILALLDALDTNSLKSIGFALQRSTKDECASLIRALQRIAARPEISNLELALPTNFATGDAAGEEETAALRALTGIKRVIISTDSIWDAYAALRWVANIPALERLTWRADPTGAPSTLPPTNREELLDFYTAVMKALPGVRYVYAG
ncbi:hypothetical protein MKEN_01143900 [Mycena kentingensis (nom. inval.)]|nr:hypothetical protein MKEN_01143900 [Mycena kentingensis (nom. inval.)]